MKVKELIKELQKYNCDNDVIVSVERDDNEERVIYIGGRNSTTVRPFAQKTVEIISLIKNN